MTDLETSGIAEWLLAQYDALERRERSRRSMPNLPDDGCPKCGYWRIEGLGFADRVAPGAFELLPCRCVLDRDEIEAFAPSECRADPGVLADLAAKRRIVELHSGKHECVAWWEQTAEDIADGEPPRTRTTYVHPEYNVNDPTLRLLASGLAHRPGYDQAWEVEV